MLAVVVGDARHCSSPLVERELLRRLSSSPSSSAFAPPTLSASSSATASSSSASPISSSPLFSSSSSTSTSSSSSSSASSSPLRPALFTHVVLLAHAAILDLTRFVPANVALLTDDGRVLDDADDRFARAFSRAAGAVLLLTDDAPTVRAAVALAVRARAHVVTLTLAALASSPPARTRTHHAAPPPSSSPSASSASSSSSSSSSSSPPPLLPSPSAPLSHASSPLLSPNAALLPESALPRSSPSPLSLSSLPHSLDVSVVHLPVLVPPIADGHALLADVRDVERLRLLTLLASSVSPLSTTATTSDSAVTSVAALAASDHLELVDVGEAVDVVLAVARARTSGRRHIVYTVAERGVRTSVFRDALDAHLRAEHTAWRPTVALQAALRARARDEAAVHARETRVAEQQQRHVHSSAAHRHPEPAFDTPVPMQLPLSTTLPPSSFIPSTAFSTSTVTSPLVASAAGPSAALSSPAPQVERALPPRARSTREDDVNWLRGLAGVPPPGPLDAYVLASLAVFALDASRSLTPARVLLRDVRLGASSWWSSCLLDDARWAFGRAFVTNRVPRDDAALRAAAAASPVVASAIANIARHSPSQTPAAVAADAARILDTMGTAHSSLAVAILSYLMRKILRAMFGRLSVAGLERWREAVDRGDGVWLLPSHRSYLDFLLLSYIAYDAGIPLPAIAAGDDFLAIAMVNHALRGSGAFFIRRSFRGDELYWACFCAYLDALVDARASIEFFIEGTRSRTNRTLAPRTGMLEQLLEAAARRRCDASSTSGSAVLARAPACASPRATTTEQATSAAITILPVSYGYEHVAEVHLHARELQGTPKPKERLGSLLSASSALSRSYGEVAVVFGTPIYPRLDEPAAALAERVVQQLDDNTPISAVALVAAIVLGSREGSVGDVGRGFIPCVDVLLLERAFDELRRVNSSAIVLPRRDCRTEVSYALRLLADVVEVDEGARCVRTRGGAPAAMSSSLSSTVPAAAKVPAPVASASATQAQVELTHNVTVLSVHAGSLLGSNRAFAVAALLLAREYLSGIQRAGVEGSVVESTRSSSSLPAISALVLQSLASEIELVPSVSDVRECMHRLRSTPTSVTAVCALASLVSPLVDRVRRLATAASAAERAAEAAMMASAAATSATSASRSPPAGATMLANEGAVARVLERVRASPTPYVESTAIYALRATAAALRLGRVDGPSPSALDGMASRLAVLDRRPRATM